MNKLGWHWWPSDSAIATTEYDGRAPCINLGHCTPACAQGAKASTDITYWPHAIRAGVELRTNCRVREITTGDDGMATGVVYYDADGVEQFQPAEVVILACNGVGTPRLLLNSASGRFPNGLANSSGLVGKNLMFHPWGQIFGYVDEEMDGHRGPRSACGARSSTRPTAPAASCAASISSSPRPGAGDGRGAWHGNRAGCPGARATTTRFANCSVIASACRHLHRGPAGRAQPCHAGSGAEGLPRHPGAEDRLHDRREHQSHAGSSRWRGHEILRAAGAQDVMIRAVVYGGWHLLGTARMGNDPARSVVNAWGRAMT